MCTIEDSITVSTPDCQSVTLTNLVAHGPDKFAKFTKSSRLIEKLLAGKSCKGERVLAATDVLETLISLRNSKREQLLQGGDEGAAEDLGLDGDTPCVSKKRRRQLKASLPSVVAIDAPSLDDVDGVRMKVLMNRPDEPLWIHLTVENLNYLRAYCSLQIEGRHSRQPRFQRPKDEIVEAPAPGVVWAWDRSSYRARFKDEEGHRRTRDFKSSDDAVAFVNGQVEPDLSLQDISSVGVLQDTF